MYLQFPHFKTTSGKSVMKTSRAYVVILEQGGKKILFKVQLQSKKNIKVEVHPNTKNPASIDIHKPTPIHPALQSKISIHTFSEADPTRSHPELSATASLCRRVQRTHPTTEAQWTR